MFCKECGEDIGDGDAKFCPNCGTPISTSSKEKKPKNNSNIKKGKKIPIKTVIIIVVVIAVISFVSLTYLEYTSRTSDIHSEIGGNYIGKEGYDFAVKANVYHKNMFGSVKIDGENINVNVKNDAGEVVNQMTIKEDEWNNFGNLPLGHYTVELSYAGDYPSTNSTRDFIVITPEEYQQKDLAEKQKIETSRKQYRDMWRSTIRAGLI